MLALWVSDEDILPHDDIYDVATFIYLSLGFR